MANSDAEAWVFWHNQQVDELANRCNFSRPTTFWQIWGEAVAATRFQRELHFEILKVHLAVARRKLEGNHMDEGGVKQVALPQSPSSTNHNRNRQSTLTVCLNGGARSIDLETYRRAILGGNKQGFFVSGRSSSCFGSRGYNFSLIFCNDALWWVDFASS